MTIKAENFRALTHFEWAPSGVCVLVGPNGAGKSTALSIFELLRRSLERGFIAGSDFLGNGPLRSFDAGNGSSQITLRAGTVSWTLALDRTPTPREQAMDQGMSLYSLKQRGGVLGGPRILLTGKDGQPMDIAAPPETLLLGTVATAGVDTVSAALLVPIHRFVRGGRYYARPALDLLRDEGSSLSNDTRLDRNAGNLFSVLRNWRDQSEHEHRYQFVTEHLAEIFSDDFRRFDFANIAQRVSAQALGKRWSAKLEPTQWADGFFMTLIHLTSAASGEPGSIVAIDEPENSLHPALIQKLIAAMREWSADQSVTVVCSTHSPSVLNQFAEEPEQVYVMEPGKSPLPVALDQLKKREWLKHYALGDLYAHSEVGAPA